MVAEERIRKLQERMAENRIDLAAIGPTTNMRYLLGYAPFADERPCMLLIKADETVMIVPGLNAEEAAAHTSIDIIPWKDADGPQGAFRQLHPKWKSPGLMAADNAMRADSLLLLMEELEPVRTIPVTGLIAPLRLVKSDREIALLARAANQADQAMRDAVEACLPGVPEKDVAWAAETSFRKQGAEEVCFTIVASGPHGAFPHHHSNERKLQAGDTIIIDIGASLDGYKSDISRVVHLGKPAPEVVRVYEAVKQANLEAAALVKPGVTTGSIDAAARDYLEQAGLGHAFIHRTGHGIGLDNHEPPWIMAGDNTVLEKGMAFSIEPGVYLPGKFGVRVEDIVIVTENGVRNLTGFDHSLVIRS